MPFRSPTRTDQPQDASAESPAARALAVVRELALPLCRAHRVDLVSVAWVTEHGGRALRVTIERKPEAGAPAGPSEERGWGVSLEDCAELSRDLSQALDHTDAVPGSYHLEVSSPGLERDLEDVADLRRFEGMLAKVKLSKPAPDGQRALRGRIVGVGGAEGSELLTMHVDKKDIVVPVADIVDAHLVFEMTQAPKQKSQTAGRSPRSNESRPKRSGSRPQPNSKKRGTPPAQHGKGSGS